MSGLFSVFKDLAKDVAKDIGQELKEEAKNKLKNMNSDDWKKLGQKGKEMASNVFQSSTSENEIKPKEIKNIPISSSKKDTPTELKELGFSENEIEYYNEYLSCYNEDNCITDAERRLLDKFLSKLDIPNDRVELIESIAEGEPISKFFMTENNQEEIVFSESEKEYIEEYRSCLDEDNDITDAERRLLNKLSDKLGITKNRIEELELFAKGKLFSSVEKEYYDEIVNCFEEDGEITDGARRLLEKLRKNLNISEKRASELEAIAEEEL